MRLSSRALLNWSGESLLEAKAEGAGPIQPWGDWEGTSSIYINVYRVVMKGMELGS